MQIWWVWFIVAAVLLVSEMFTMTFVLLWFGIGAFLAGASAAFGFSTVYQVGIYV